MNVVVVPNHNHLNSVGHVSAVGKSGVGLTSVNTPVGKAARAVCQPGIPFAGEIPTRQWTPAPVPVDVALAFWHVFHSSAGMCVNCLRAQLAMDLLFRLSNSESTSRCFCLHTIRIMEFR